MFIESEVFGFSSFQDSNEISVVCICMGFSLRALSLREFLQILSTKFWPVSLDISLTEMAVDRLIVSKLLYNAKNVFKT